VARIVVALMALASLCSCDNSERWVIADPAFYPVSVDYWADDRSFLVGSYEHGAVLRVSAEGVEDAVPYLPASFTSDGRRKALRLNVDSPRDRLWILDSDRVYLYSLRRRSLLAKFDLPNAARVSAGSCLPDMTLNPFSGTVYIADAREPKLHVISEQTGTEALVRTELAVLAPPDAPAGAFTALAVIAEQPALLAASAETGRLWRINPFTGQAQAVAQSGAMLKGVCGMRALALRVGAYEHRRDAHHELYIGSSTGDSIRGVRLSAALDRAEVVDLTRVVALDTPVGLAVVDGYVLAAGSQLARHPDLGGDGRPAAPFRLVAIPGALAPLANEARVAGRMAR
jgi:hypothetical protein